MPDILSYEHENMVIKIVCKSQSKSSSRLAQECNNSNIT